jgi:3D (Asp-Asp-Asp) domain-containing protein
VERLKLLLVAFGICALVVLTGCGTTSRPLPQYESPLAKTDFQTVRTTAYTHTEADHRAYTNHNALGGKLQAAGPPIRRVEVVPRAIPLDADEQSDYETVSYSGAPRQPFSVSETRSVTRSTRVTRTTRGAKRAVAVARPRIGSAAADWSRWPAGTIFRLLSTGQIYKVDDYGWALSGRNTIDLYMATPNEMNMWGARSEPVQILQWGDPVESLRFLERHQEHRHIKRMVLELRGDHREAARME